MRCKQCGQALSRGQTVCPSCGNSVEKQLRRARNRRRFIVIALLIVLCTAALLFLNLRSRGELPELSVSSLRSLLSREEPAAEPSPADMEEPETPEADAEPSPVPVEEPSAVPADAAEDESAPAEPVETEAEPAVAAEPVPVAATPAVEESEPEEPAAEALLSPVEAFRAAEAASFARFSAAFCASYGAERAALLESGGSQALVDYTLSFGDAARRALEESSGLSMSWLKALALSVDSRSAGESASMDLAASLNGTPVASARLVMDLLDGGMTAVVPELSAQPFSVAAASGDTAPLTRAQLAALAAALPGEEELGRLLERYFALFLQNVTEVERGSGMLEAEGILAPCTTLTAAFDELSVRRVAASVIGELRWDEELRGYIEGAAEALGASPAESYERFLSRLDELDYELSVPAEQEETAALVIYVGEDGAIYGRSLTWNDGRETVRLTCAIPRDGERFGLELRYADGSLYELSGRGTRAGDSVTGEFVLRANADRLARLSLARAGAGDGRDAVELSVTPSSAVCAALLPASLSDFAHDLSLTLRSEGDEARYALRAELLAGGEAALTLTADGTPGNDAEVAALGEPVSQEAWSAALSAESFEAVLSNLKAAGMPSGLLAQLKSSLNDAFPAPAEDGAA